mgnify:FL=1
MESGDALARPGFCRPRRSHRLRASYLAVTLSPRDRMKAQPTGDCCAAVAARNEDWVAQR